jgi:hypothetical protein
MRLVYAAYAYDVYEARSAAYTRNISAATVRG